MNLTAAHPKDITCLEIDWAEQHWNCIYSRHAYDLDGPHSASVNEHRKAVHQSYFLINYQETSRLSAGDVAEDTAIHYI